MRSRDAVERRQVAPDVAVSSGMSRDLQVLADGLSFLEGPRWHDGRLFVSDFYTHRVLAFDQGGGVETICTVPQQPSGLGWLPDGSLLVVSMLDRRLLRLEDNRLVEHADLSRLAPWHCNDMVVDRAGRAYVGNFGFDDGASAAMAPTHLICVQPDGSAGIAAGGLVFPNGVVIDADGGRMMVAETFAGRISAYTVDADGSLSDRTIWAAFTEHPETTLDAAVSSGVPMPDGMALDVDGALWIGDAAGSGALRVREGGEVIETVPTGDLAVYAVALGGADRRTLYLCAAPPLPRGRPKAELKAMLLSCRVDSRGVGLP